MRRFLATLAVSVVTVSISGLISGCAAEPDVDWGGKYSSTVKKRLDQLAEEKDCGRLLAELDTAYSIDRAKAGGSGDLVSYIKYALDRANCDIPKDRQRN